MNALRALGAIATLAVATTAFADDLHTVEVGSFVNTGVGVMSYTGSFGSKVEFANVDGHTLIGVDLAGILDSLGYNMLWSITVTDNGFNSYGSMSPGADIDLFRVDGASSNAIYSYNGPNPVHQTESSARLAERMLLLDSFSGAQDAWNLTHVSLGQNGSATATFEQPLDLRDFISNPGNATTGGVFGPGFNPYTPPLPPIDPQSGDNPFLVVSEHGTFESFRISLIASTAPVPAPGALALLGVAGALGKKRRRRN